MLGLRSFIGLTLSLLAHAGAAAYFLSQEPVILKPKPKEIPHANGDV